MLRLEQQQVLGGIPFGVFGCPTAELRLSEWGSVGGAVGPPALGLQDTSLALQPLFSSHPPKLCLMREFQPYVGSAESSPATGI